MSDLHRVTPRRAKSYIKDCIEAKLVPFVQSSPGLGKSSIMRDVSKEYNLKLIDHRLSTSTPEDLSGLPRLTDTRATFVPFDIFPVEDTPIPAGYEGWNIFLDEFNSAAKSVQAAGYKLVLDKMTGQYPLHPNVVITAAGNLDTDRAIINKLSTAMQSRLVHIEMIVSFEEWLYDVALPLGYDSRIIAYLNQYQGELMDFRPDHADKTFCCPRTWEFMNNLVKDKPVTDEKTALYAGTITSLVATKFVQFTKVFAEIPSIQAILNDPENCQVPYNNDHKWAVVSVLMEQVNDQNFDKLALYINRFSDVTFRILFFRSVMVRHQELRRHPAFTEAMRELTRYLHG